MRLRATKAYKQMNAYEACSIVEGFSGRQHREQEVLAAWQYLVDSGLAWRLQGFYGRTAHALIAQGLLQKGN